MNETVSIEKYVTAVELGEGAMFVLDRMRMEEAGAKKELMDYVTKRGGYEGFDVQYEWQLMRPPHTGLRLRAWCMVGVN